MTENYKDIVKRLGDSPMFNMSLGSKELFHTNMLNWLAKRYPKEFVGLITDIVGPKCTWVENFHKIFPKIIEKPQDGDYEYYIKREKDNFDFSIWEKSYTIGKKGIKYKDHPVFILENKVKSIPTKGQLDGYVNKAEKIYGKNHGTDKVFYVLLSLSTPSDEIREDEKWHILYYDNEDSQKSYLNMLKKNFLNKKEYINNIIVDGGHRQFLYDEQLINDYCGFIKNLQLLANEWEKNFLNTQTVYKYDYKSEEFKAYENIRIHDLYEKIKMSEIAKNLRGENQIASDNITTGYSDEQGILDCDLFTYNKKNISSNEKDKKSWIAIRIEIQGNRYKRCIVFNCGKFKKEDLDSIKDCDIIKKFLYFNDSSEIMSCKKDDKYSIFSKRYHEVIPFNSYGENFMYIDATIGTNITIGKLIEQIKIDYEQVKCLDETSLTELFKRVIKK